MIRGTGRPVAGSRGSLLAWYESRRAAYPWRLRVTPYRVLVSEVMLQQTQAARVAPAFRAFVRKFPSVRSLARATRAEVLRAWAGLGYNRRAVVLAEAARAIVRDHGGRVPKGREELERLPGVGPYTAAAVASLGHGVVVAAIDTNVGRVVSRAVLGRDDAPGAAVRRAAAEWVDDRDPASWNQALMDLGREVCRPRPRCDACPLAGMCRYRRRGATPAPAGRRQPAFEGSSRQARGAVVRALLEGGASLGGLVRRTGYPPARIAAAVSAMAAEGLVCAGPAALAGHPRGRVRLGD